MINFISVEKDSIVCLLSQGEFSHGLVAGLIVALLASVLFSFVFSMRRGFFSWRGCVPLLVVGVFYIVLWFLDFHCQVSTGEGVHSNTQGTVDREGGAEKIEAETQIIQKGIPAKLYEPTVTKQEVRERNVAQSLQGAAEDADTLIPTTTIVNHYNYTYSTEDEGAAVERTRAGAFLAIDKDTVGQKGDLIYCKDDGHLLQWEEYEKKWFCEEPYHTVFDAIDPSTVSIASDGAIFCTEDARALVWDASARHWKCGLVGGDETITSLTSIAGHRVATYTNESGIQQGIYETVTELALAGSQLTYIDEAGTENIIDLSTFLDNTDAQAISLSGTTLTLSGGTGASTTVDLSVFLDDADDQVFTEAVLDGTTLRLAIEDGNTVNVDLSSIDTDTDTHLTEAEVDAFVGNNGYLTVETDGSTTNELITTATLASSTLTIVEAGTSHTIDLSSLLDNTDTLASLSCGDAELPRYNATSGEWECAQSSLSTLSCTNTQIASYNATSGEWECTDASSLETTTTLTNTVTGNRIGTYTDEDGGTTDLFETITEVSTSGSVITYTDEEGNDTTIDIKDLETTTTVAVNTTAQTITYTDEDGGTTTINVTDLETTTTLTDNSDGSFTYTNEDGTSVTFTETLTTLVDNANGTLTYTNEDGTTTTVDHKDFTIDSSVTYTDGKLSCANTDEVLHWSGTLWSCDTVDNLVTHSSLTDNTDGTFTHTSGSGTVAVVDHKDMTVDGTTALYTDGKISCATDEHLLQWDTTNTQWTCVDITAIETTTTLVIDTANQQITYTNEDGTATVVDFTSLETLTTLTNTIAGHRIGTYTDEDGNTFDIHETITDISTTGSTITYTKEDGTTTTVDIKDLETTTTLTDNSDGSFTYTNEDGTATTWTETLTSIAASGSTITYTDEDGNDTDIDIKDLETTTVLTQNANGTLTYTDEDGNDTTVAAQSFVQGGGDITVTGTGSNADPYVISFTEVHTTLTDLITTGNTIGTYTNENGDTYTLKETITGLALNTNSLDYTDEAGNTTNIDLSSYIDTYTNGSGLSLTGNTFSINAPTCSGTDKLQWNGSSFVCGVDVDTDTTYTGGSGLSLTGTQFTINAPTCVATEKLSWNGTAFQCLADIDTDTDTDTTYTAGSGLALTGTTFAINAPTCTGTDKLIWNGTVFLCTADIDTDTDTLAGLTCSDEQIAAWDATGSAWVCGDQPSGIDITCSSGQFLQYSGTDWVCVDDDLSPALDQIANVGESYLWAGNVTDPDIHLNNNPVDLTQTRADTGWATVGTNGIQYTGAPDHVEIDFAAVANNTGNHWAHPHVKIFRNGVEIGEGSGLYMDDSGTYSGRTTTQISMVDETPGTNPLYTFVSFEDDSRTMNNPTIPDSSPVSLKAIEVKTIEATEEYTKAFGKAAGDGTDLRVNGATVTRTATGQYTVTLATARPTSDYTVQLTTLEPTTTRDNVTARVASQATGSFTIEISEGDNSAAADTLVDRTFYFEVIDFD